MQEPNYRILDRATGGRSLHMRVEPDAHGVCVTALDDRNQPLAAVMLDFFNDKLSAVVTRGWESEPQPIQVLVDRVHARRPRRRRRRRQLCCSVPQRNEK